LTFLAFDQPDTCFTSLTVFTVLTRTQYVFFDLSLLILSDVFFFAAYLLKDFFAKLRIELRTRPKWKPKENAE